MPSISVALVQTDICWLDAKSNLERLEKMLSEVDGTDLIVLPETFATGFAFDLAEVTEPQEVVLTWMQQLAASKNAVVCGSVAVSQDDKKANRLYWVTPEGTVQHYDKRHLFRMGNEQDYVVAGKQRAVFELNGFRILPQVCYDLRFPVWARNRNDYDVMINIANWPAARRFAYDTLLKARAMENQCFVLAVNRIGEDGKGVVHSGGTALYDFKGETIGRIDDDCCGIVRQTLSLSDLEHFRQAFPAHLDADDFNLA